MEKEILKETVSKEKPSPTKKRTYKPRKKKTENKNTEGSVVDDMVMRSGEIHLPNSFKRRKEVGSYKIGRSFQIYFEKKPNPIHRFFSKLLLGWEWHDQK
jgi:hypothetical protein